MKKGMEIGTDIQEIKEFSKVLSKDSQFLNKIFDSKEIDYCMSKRNPEIHFAGKFSAKEAVRKAVFDEYKLDFRDIIVLNDKTGKPNVLLSKKIKGSVKVSISHSGNYALAFAIYTI